MKKIPECCSNIQEYVFSGAFGDREVRVASCLPKEPNGIQIVLLHGVHSSANMGEHNKFRFLSKLLSDRGYTPWLVETSRKIRNRQDFSNDVPQWIKKAFSGKTFAQEQQDVFTAISDISTATQGKPLWVWGFSLGGIIALSAAAKNIDCRKGDGSRIPERVIVSGTGLVAFKDVEERMMSLPVLSTLRREIASDMLSHVKVKGLISFRGSCDEIFSEKSCLGVLREVNLPEEDKHFFVIEGADHSFRSRYGKADPEIMKELVDHIVKTWS
ncbi:MAG: alpha/beta hydrolase [Synergistaceae bacterium]|nr:alpha/beta hydrolase [Synergistaceae bacterium]